MREPIDRTGKVGRGRVDHVYEATRVVGESTRRAVADAREWLGD